MAINQKDTISRDKIRTMKKDIQQARESGSVKEREKITKTAAIAKDKTAAPAFIKTDKIEGVKQSFDLGKSNQKTSKPFTEQKEEIKSKQLAKGEIPETIKKPEENLELINKAQRQNEIKPIETIKENYIKETPLTAKEKLVESVKVEEEKRKKFMEDVEEWAGGQK